MTDAKTKSPITASGVGETMSAAGEGLPVPSALASAPGTLTAQLIAGRYEILSLLGTGGMGTVYRARDLELDEVVALKVLRAELVDSPDILARFRQEARLARRVTHKNVARTFDIGEHAGEKFLTMEFVDGESLASVIGERGRLPLAEVVHIVHEVCAGMSAAHAAGVVHRDLKPDNVLVGKDGRIVVTDFGIARAAAGAAGAGKTIGGIVGTPAYMAPEQVEGGADIDARADIYALGAMTFELLTGDRAWPGDAPFVVAAARLIHPPPDPCAALPALPRAVGDVIMRCMAKGRGDRYASADDVAEALREAASGSGSSRVGMPVSAIQLSDVPRVDSGADKTIAVLPFTNGGPPEDEYLAEGITEDLIDVLSMTRGLRVRPRGAVAHLRAAARDPRVVGSELGVQVVVDGSVRRSGSGIRVNARLVSAADGFQLWAKRFDRPAGDVLAVNDEAAHAIAEALTVSAPSAPRVAPTDPVAIDLYLRASYEHHKLWREDAVRAVELYEQALARAPNDPTILAGCARARVRVAFFGGEGTTAMLALARAAADRAVAGAPDNGESWTALASTRMMGGDAPGAVRALVTALQKSQGLVNAHDLLGRILVEVGRPEKAIGHMRTAIAIDPTLVGTRLDLARAHALMGNWAEADALIDLPAPGTSGQIGKFLYRARLSLWRGTPHPDLGDPPVMGPEMGIMVDTEGLIEVLRTRELPDAYREMMEASAQKGDAASRRRTLYFQLNTELYAWVFEVDHALASLREAIDSGLIDVVWLDRCPVLGPLRADARFGPLRAEVDASAQRVIAALEAS